MRPAAEAEKLGIPSVVITTTGFTNIARAAGKAQGVTGLRVAEYPGAVGVHTEAVVEENVEKVLFERIVNELVLPRTNEAGDAVTHTQRADEIGRAHV